MYVHHVFVYTDISYTIIYICNVFIQTHEGESARKHTHTHTHTHKQVPYRKWYLWVADSLAKQHAQGLIADMMRRRWLKLRFKRILQGWHSETESGAGDGRGREELLVLLNEQVYFCMCFVCIWLCMCEFVPAYVGAFMSVYVCMCIYIYICMYIYIYMCTCKIYIHKVYERGAGVKCSNAAVTVWE